MVLDRCIKCNTCKYAYKEFTPSCPSGETFKFESYWASGRIRIARGVLTRRLEWTDAISDPIFACTTCGACVDSCQAPHKDRIVDIIEALREFAVKTVGAPSKQARMVPLVVEHFNPYGTPHSDNAEIRARYHLNPTASVVYFIGCTSNYRQQRLRDATLSVLQKLGVDFTVGGEHHHYILRGMLSHNEKRLCQVWDRTRHERDAFLGIHQPEVNTGRIETFQAKKRK